MAMNLEEELDTLYRLPPAEFVAGRNALVKRLRKDGDREAASRVKALPRPSLTAWAVNQLHFRARAELDALIAAGDEVRSAHLAGVQEQQAAAKTRREAVAALLVIADGFLEETGTTPGRIHRQRISRSLEALASRVAGSEAPAAGRLSKDLEPAGFDAVADLALALGAAQTARLPRRGLKLVPDPRAEAAEPAVAPEELQETAQTSDRQKAIQARQALERLQDEATEQRREAERTAAGLEQAQRAEAELEAAAGEAERHAREARARAREAKTLTAQARRTAAAAAAAATHSEAGLKAARKKLERLEHRS